MRQGKRFGLSAIEKSDIWRRWKAGETLHEIGRAFDKPHSSIRCLLLPRGGIPPAARRRSCLALTPDSANRTSGVRGKDFSGDPTGEELWGSPPLSGKYLHRDFRLIFT